MYTCEYPFTAGTSPTVFPLNLLVLRLPVRSHAMAIPTSTQEKFDYASDLSDRIW